MSSITRRQVLASSAMVGLSASLAGTARAKVAETLLQSCPHCSADLAMGDLHWPGCMAEQGAAPSDSEIKLDTIKTAQAQQRSSEKPSTGSQKRGTYGPDPCEQYNCDRCKVQKAAKGGYCYHKNIYGCAVQSQC